MKLNEGHPEIVRFDCGDLAYAHEKRPT